MASHKAKVIVARLVTPAICFFRFQALDSKSTHFYAGQWIDLQIPGTDVIGGYSMCSSPAEFVKSGCFDLAVKISIHPASTWMHNECKVGMEMSFNFGGEVYLDEANLALGHKAHLLVAGGIGINPLYSILQTLVPLATKPTILLYSAQDNSELIYSEDIDQLAAKTNNLSVKYFLTKDDGANDIGGSGDRVSRVYGRRICKEDLASITQNFGPGTLKAYVCGPPEMTTSIIDTLQSLGVPEADTHYELWW